jgi:tetratricopeptide (TPR) repeat protein
VQEKYSKAESLYLRSYSILQEKLGSEHPNVAISLSNIGKLYHLQKRYGEAESSFQRAIPILEQALGSEHPKTITARENYALLREVMAGESA